MRLRQAHDLLPDERQVRQRRRKGYRFREPQFGLAARIGILQIGMKDIGPGGPLRGEDRIAQSSPSYSEIG
jgi:hypothetical protein